MSTLWRADRVRRVSMDAMLVAFAVMLSYLEVLLPLEAVIPLPGFRLGLANIAVLVVFCLFSPIDAAIVSAVRILLMGLLFGSATSLYFYKYKFVMITNAKVKLRFLFANFFRRKSQKFFVILLYLKI